MPLMASPATALAVQVTNVIVGNCRWNTQYTHVIELEFGFEI